MVQSQGSGTRQPVSFRRQAVAMGTAMTAIEVAVIAWPMWGLFGRMASEPARLLEGALLGAAAMQIVWWVICGAWLRHLVRVGALKLRGEPIPDALARAAYHSSWWLPGRMLLLRTACWVGLSAAIGWHARVPSREIAQLAALTFVLSFTAAAFRSLWASLVATRIRDHLFPRVEELRRFADGYFGQLVLVCAAIAGVTTAAIIAFIYFFLPITIEPFLRLSALAPLALVLAMFGVLLVARRYRGHMERYLFNELDADDPPSRGEVDAAAARVYRRTQLLPYQLSAVHVLVWLGAGVCAVWVARTQLGLDSDDAVLMLGIVVAMAVGSSIYLALWYREIFRPVRTHLTLKHPLPQGQPRGAFSLRAKLLLSFGGMMLFACGMALFWGFMQYKNLVTRFTAKQAELGLALLRSEVEAAAATREVPPGTGLVETVLSRVNEQNSDVGTVYYFLSRDADTLFAFGGGPMGAPPLPWYTRAQLTLESAGSLDFRSQGLSGRRGPLRVSWHGQEVLLGTLAVFHPSYRGRGVAVVRPLKELLFFFLILFGTCAGIVLLTVAQFVKPIRRLEQRAEGMARGELAQPVSSEGEGDEIGRLTFALEQMRRALREKIRTTEEVNLDLERAVQRRTADLARKNRELGEALQKLTRAQDQLVRAEKMASIGQLVAGIAHEINNPVNAIVNTVGPLEQAIEDVQTGSAETREEAASDLKDMIRVVHRGAERTKGIVQALHNYSRTDEESVVDVSLNRSLDDSLELLRHVLKQHIAVERNYGDVGRVRGHAGQLNQVFMNLLTNAAQALTGVDGARIRVRTELQSGRVAITIADNGKGIPPDVLPRIFDPFFTTKDVGEGTGLGLSIVHGIVERHGGTIEVKSQVESGTEFVVYLPIAAEGPPERSAG